MEPLNNGWSDISLLFVEDDPLVRGVIWLVLTHKFTGMDIHTAENGEVGLELFKKHNPHIVLTDINMPVMDGIRMATEIRALKPDAAIIVLTACRDEGCLLDAIKAGVNHFVLKPISNKLLVAAIEDCIERISLERQVESQKEYIRRLSAEMARRPLKKAWPLPLTYKRKVKGER